MKTCIRLPGAPQAQQEASSSFEICLRIVSDTCMALQAAECPGRQHAMLDLAEKDSNYDNGWRLQSESDAILFARSQ